MKLKQLLLIAVAAISLASCKNEDRDIITFSVANVIFPSTGGTKEISIYCKEEWSVTIPEKSWIESVTPMSGKGNARVKVTAKENNTNEVRGTELGFNSQLFAVYQEIGVVEIDLLYGKWETTDGNYKFTFNEDNTCHAEMSMGVFDGTYTIEGNIITIKTTGSPKGVTIVVKSIEKEKSMVASMGGKSLYLEYKEDKTILFSSPNLTFPSTGGTKEIGINCKVEWSVTIPEKSWIESVTPMSGKGSAKVTVTAKENTTKESRVIELGFNSQLLAVYQEIGVVEIDLLYGKWETKDGNYKFTFNEDNTCHAEMSMGVFDGTYTIEGNIITIKTTGSPKGVTIVVKSIEKEKSMVASMGGTSLYLEYKI